MAAPNYYKPTLSANNYEYTNREQDLIKQAFEAGNYTYLSKFPHRLKPLSLTNNLKKLSRSVLETPRKPRSLSLSKNHFEWMPDSYNNWKEALSKERQKNKEKRELISQNEFRWPGISKKSKAHEGFSDGKRAYITIDDPFDSFDSQAYRMKWIKECQMPSETFRPPLKPETNLSKMQIRDMISFIKNKIVVDWEDCMFVIGINSDDMIEIRFEEETIENPKGLHNYMNLLIENDEEIHYYKLRKIVQKWGFKTDGFITYVMSPPWVHSRVSDTFYSLHPEQSPKGSAFSSITN
ncbi:unnamed protein product [Blepharisma stoltei]|uniref:Uncharacterized protein n=1 Tax=Blepharisma stoltei TaxID=1481888 RepID=A0AAU9JJC3_9CILI|nr:unnamed protein product [Blepharisma stoltei]